jgi:hypothetical protein
MVPPPMLMWGKSGHRRRRLQPRPLLQYPCALADGRPDARPMLGGALKKAPLRHKRVQASHPIAGNEPHCYDIPHEGQGVVAYLHPPHRRKCRALIAAIEVVSSYHRSTAQNSLVPQ